jgi:non-specific serine/threonine protein kinase
MVGGEVVSMPYQKAVALLAYLACQGEAVERDHLRHLLWPALDSKKAAANLRHAVHFLRRSLGDALGGHGESLWLDRSRVWLDLDWLADSKPLESIGEFCEGLCLQDCAPFENWLSKQRALHRKLESPSPTRAKQPARGNLPAQLWPMVGGREHLSEAEDLLRKGRLLTITGPAGVGKTRLAVELGHQVQPDCPRWLVELGSLFDSEHLTAKLGSTLGVVEGPGDAQERLEAELAMSDTLLILDNCEHLVSGVAILVTRLLQRCPRLRIVATSRELLRVPGESVMNLDPLATPPESCRDPEAISGFPAVELFVQRARAAAPLFVFNQENALSVAAICRRLDGLPLAIELAAVRARALSVEQIARGLNDRFRLLRGGLRTVPQRQQTLEAALAWSYDLLPPDEQRIFRRLCVFASSFDLEAATAICEPNEQPEAFLDALTSLIDRSMIVCKDRAHGYRYGMLETVRDFAFRELERLPEMVDVRARHFEHFLHRAQHRAVQGVVGLLELEEDHGNYCLALEWGLNTKPQEAATLAAELGDFWFYRGHFNEGAAYLDRALEVRRCPKALLWSGRLHQALGEYARALSEFEQSASLAGDPLDQARAWNARAAAGYSQGDYKGSSHFAQAALEVWQNQGQTRGIVDTLNILATAQICLGQDAEPHLRRSVQLSKDDDYSWGLSGALYLQGLQELYRGHYQCALSLLAESLSLCREQGNAPRMAACLGNMGLAAVASQDFQAAADHLQEGTALAESSGYRGVMAFMAYGNGYRALRQGKPEPAIDHLRESLRVLLSIHVREGAELVLLCLADALGPEAMPLRKAALSSLQANESVLPAYLSWLGGDPEDSALSLEQAMRVGADLPMEDFKH